MGSRGDGTIYKRKDGRWEAALSLGDGKRRRFYGKTRRDVREQLTAALHDRDLGIPVAADARQTTGQYLEVWLATARPRLKPRTWTRYAEYVRLHASPTLGAIPLVRLSAQHLARLYAARLDAGMSPTTVHHLHALLHRALSTAVRQALVPRNVADLVDPPRMAHHEMAVLDATQARALLAAAAGDRLEALYVLALATGMRQGEILALHWADLDLDDTHPYLQVRGTLQRVAGRDGEAGKLAITTPKTAGSRRRILLTWLAAASLRRHRARQAEERLALADAWDDHDLVFCNELGRPIEAGNLIARSFRPLLRRAGLPTIRFHDLRHTTATLLLRAAIHPKVVADLLGHASITTTLTRYSHVLPALQRDAVAALDATLTPEREVGHATP